MTDFDPFNCTIFFERMEEPMINIKTGITYDKSTIENMIRRGLDDPHTGEEMTMDDFVSNRALKDAIKIYGPLENKNKELEEIVNKLNKHIISLKEVIATQDAHIAAQREEIEYYDRLPNLSDSNLERWQSPEHENQGETTQIGGKSCKTKYKKTRKTRKTKKRRSSKKR